MRSWQDALKSALFICLNGLSSLHFLMMSIVFLFITAIFSTFGKWSISKKNSTRSNGNSLKGHTLATNPLIIAVAVISLGLILVVPFYIPYIYLAWTHQIGPRPLPDYVIANSDDLLSFNQLPGIFAPLLLLGYCLTPKRMHTRLFSCVAVNAVGAFILSKGPMLIVNGASTFVPLPYCALLVLPIFNCLRAPYRFLLLGEFFFAVLAGLSVYAVVVFTAQKFRIAKALIHPAAALILAGVILIPIDYALQPMFGNKVQSPSEIAPCYKWLAKAPDTTIVAEYPRDFGVFKSKDLGATPLDGDDALYTYMSCFHWHRIINGAASYYPASLDPFAGYNIDSLPCPSSLENLAALGVTHIFVHLKPLPSNLGHILFEFTSALHPDTMSDTIVVPLDSIRQRIEAKNATGKQLVCVSSMDKAELGLPAGTKVRLALPVQYGGAIWTNTRPNFSEKFKVSWTRNEGSRQDYKSTMECFLPPILRSGVKDAATCLMQTPEQPGEYVLECTSAPAWLEAFKIPVNLVASRVTSSGNAAPSPKAKLAFASPIEITGTSGPSRTQIRITNTGKIPLLEQAQIHLNLSNLFGDLSAGKILRPADAWYSAFVTGDKVEVRPEWIDGNGKTCVVELNGNAILPAPLYPGTTIEMPITLFAPSEPGNYKLRLHLELEKILKTCLKGASRTQPVDLAIIEHDVKL